MKERKLHVDAGENVHTILHYLYHFYHYQKALPQSRAWAFQRRKTSPLVLPPPLLLLSQSSDVIRHFYIITDVKMFSIDKIEENK